MLLNICNTYNDNSEMKDIDINTLPIKTVNRTVWFPVPIGFVAWHVYIPSSTSCTSEIPREGNEMVPPPYLVLFVICMILPFFIQVIPVALDDEGTSHHIVMFVPALASALLDTFTVGPIVQKEKQLHYKFLVWVFTSTIENNEWSKFKSWILTLFCYFGNLVFMTILLYNVEFTFQVYFFVLWIEQQRKAQLVSVMQFVVFESLVTV